MLRISPCHLLISGLAVLCTSSAAPGPQSFSGESAILIPSGAVWRYLDIGTGPGTAWRGLGYDDSKWASGPAEMGYGDGDEATVVSYGPLSSDKHITTYFRRSFVVPNLGEVWNPTLKLLRDDGAVVYLNGTEVVRSNMPEGAVVFDTRASTSVGGNAEERFESFAIDRSLFRNGVNVLAVEVHQEDETSSDVSFDLELFARPFTTVVRGPYLQRGAPTGAVVCWRTNLPTGSSIWLGTDPAELDLVAFLNTAVTDHAVPLLGLLPETTYYYAVGDRFDVLAGGDNEHRFTTPPPVGVNRPVRIWAIGDSGTRNSGIRAVRDAFFNLPDYRTPDVWLMLGDNAYDHGEDDEYQEAVFDVFPSLLRSTFLWPTPGNHDMDSADSETGTGVYYDIFDLPRRGESGGVPSGSEAYYSFDHGDVHFISLDSDDTDRELIGPMMTWLQADLAATNARWIIAFWHHPPYSMGSHESDGDGRKGDMREIAVPILEAGGVDLVLSGHSHSYERSYLLDGHYGDSDTLIPTMKLDRGNGREPGDGSYAKPSARKGAHEGAVFLVAGSAGRVDGGDLDHPAMAVSIESLGSVVINIAGSRLDARFVDEAGAVRDSFTLLKGVSRSLTRDEPAVSLENGGIQNLFLDAGAAFAGESYLLAGSFDTRPGFEMGTVHVPLNPDPWLRFSLGQVNTVIYQNTANTLDGQGRAQAAINVPTTTDPALIGLELHHAFVVHRGAEVLMASNPVKLRLVR